LSDHLAVSDFVHPNDNLEARAMRAFFVLRRPKMAIADAIFADAK
jgi:hypothetical protein